MWDLVYGPALSETGALSCSKCDHILPQTRTHTLVPSVPQGRCPGSSLWPRGLGCHMRLDKGTVTVPPTLTAGVAHLEALPITFNEPHVSPGKKWYLGQVPSPHPCLSLFVPLSPFLGSSQALPDPTHSLFPHYSPGSLGAGERGCTYKPEPLFDNLFLSSSCWQAAGEEQRVNEAPCSGLLRAGRAACEPALVTGS